MKALKFWVLGCLVFCLSGCLEMNEELTVNENGSGVFAVNMDMGQMLDMMKSFMPPEELAKAGQAKDTTINMKDLIDTSKAISAENKALFRDGSMRLQMNMEEKLFKVNLAYPFKSMDNLQKLYGSLGSGATGMGELMKGMQGGSSPMGAMGGAQPEMKGISSYFDLETKKNSIVRKLNKTKYAALLTDSMMQQVKQMGAMTGGLQEVKLNTVVKLPSAAKKITGSKAELSTDKKTVLLRNSMQDIFDHPEAFEFSVEY